MTEEIRMENDKQRCTVDGVPVKLGDVVWRAASHLNTVRSCKLDRWHLGSWWSTIRLEIYSTEHAALASAIARQRKVREKLKRAIRSADTAIERLTARLREIR